MGPPHTQRLARYLGHLVQRGDYRVQRLPVGVAALNILVQLVVLLCGGGAAVGLGEENRAADGFGCSHVKGGNGNMVVRVNEQTLILQKLNDQIKAYAKGMKEQALISPHNFHDDK